MKTAKDYTTLYHQIFTTKRIAKTFVVDSQYCAESGLDTIAPGLRVNILRYWIGFILAMYTTYTTILQQNLYAVEEQKWAMLIWSRTRLTKFGEKDIEGASFRLIWLMKDLEALGTPWESLTEHEKFVEVCATCRAIESLEDQPGGIPTHECKTQMALLIPKVFKALNLKVTK